VAIGHDDSTINIVFDYYYYYYYISVKRHLAMLQHGGIMVRVLDLRPRGCFHFPAISLSCNDFGQVVDIHIHLSHQAVQCGTSQRAVMLCGCEGNHKPGVALAMRHRLKWYTHLRAQWHTKGRSSQLHSSGVQHFNLMLCIRCVTYKNFCALTLLVRLRRTSSL